MQSSAPPNKTPGDVRDQSCPNPHARGAAAGVATGGATQVFRAARLVPQNPEAGKQSYALALKPTNLGADSSNEIRVSGPGVDSKHAQIAVSMGGFTIVDLVALRQRASMQKKVPLSVSCATKT